MVSAAHCRSVYLEAPVHTKIPDPTTEPFWDVEPACRFLGIGRSLGYELIRRGEFPVPVVTFGTRIKVPTRGLLEAAGMLAQSGNGSDLAP
jgi:hypothetical protein